MAKVEMTRSQKDAKFFSLWVWDGFQGIVGLMKRSCPVTRRVRLVES
jgi:hypothetical protein